MKGGKELEMKRTRILPLVLAAVILASLALAGCGVSQTDYDELFAQKTALEAEKQAQQDQFDTLQTTKEALEVENQSLEADYGQLTTAYNTLEGNFQTMQEMRDAIEAQLLAVSDQLAALQAVYPPRDFTSLRELEDWLLANDVSDKPITSTAEAWIGRALEVQEDALADGYVVSVDYDGPDANGLYSVFCTTVINGNIYFWDPETDNVLQDTSLGTVE